MNRGKVSATVPTPQQKSAKHKRRQEERNERTTRQTKSTTVTSNWLNRLTGVFIQWNMTKKDRNPAICDNMDKLGRRCVSEVSQS